MIFQKDFRTRIYSRRVQPESRCDWRAFMIIAYRSFFQLKTVASLRKAWTTLVK